MQAELELVAGLELKLSQNKALPETVFDRKQSLASGANGSTNWPRVISFVEEKKKKTTADRNQVSSGLACAERAQNQSKEQQITRTLMPLNMCW